MIDKARIKQAKQRISNEQNWIKGEMAQDADGKGVLPNNSKAVRFCATGALCAEFDLKIPYFSNFNNRATDEEKELFELFKSVIRDKTISLPENDRFEEIEIFNDLGATKHQDVMELFDTVINRLDSEEETNAK